MSKESQDPPGDGTDSRLPPAAVQRAYDEYASDLRAFLWAFSRNATAADELVQATFLKLAEQGHSARPATLRGWLFRVAANECLAWRRRQARDQRGLPRIAESTAARLPETPAEAAARSDEIQRVRRALLALSPEQRAVVEQRIYAGRTFAHIASESGVPLGTVLGRMQAALRVLASVLTPPGGPRG